MGHPVLKPRNHRMSLRRPLMGELTGRLLLGWRGRPVSCLAVDVSAEGIRILAREELPAGIPMFLKFEEKIYPLVVVWCQPDGKDKRSYACGLSSTGGTNLEQLFVSIGWLDQTDIRGTDAWTTEFELVNIAEDEE